MKKEERIIYLSLLQEVNADLCLVCKYSTHESNGCCEGYHYCEHPIEKLCEQMEEGLDIGQDCWGFKPNILLESLIDLIGVIISQDYDEWGYMRYSKSALTVFGRNYKTGNISESKVRIGHAGKDSG